ncbi:uncharacterized protein PgNI_10039 [Pyricularia grisea]|uniref:Uncharacterized protein n=1 Tax=Pyricularia grisea TaxID=148305 RepID=A0A6P8ATQ0_PYRGI|nr:uncharacterized protein PgNI_10039 [Pyricularia grisea]TLD05467.1 hypothetical protein PgNI_10039 [Pyricularia grisea]
MRDDSPNGATSGRASDLIEQSLTQINKIYHSYYDGFLDMTATAQMTIRRMESLLATIPESKANRWLNIMIELITMGAMNAAASLFHTFLETLPAMDKGFGGLDIIKETHLMMDACEGYCAESRRGLAGYRLPEDLLQIYSPDHVGMAMQGKPGSEAALRYMHGEALEHGGGCLQNRFSAPKGLEPLSSSWEGASMSFIL